MDDARIDRSDLVGDEGRAERSRIERVYKAYSSDPYYKKIWTDDAARYILERKWEDIRRALDSERLAVDSARLLDLGAGEGGDCERFRQLGLRPERILALDVLRDEIRKGRSARGWLVALQGDGALLPFRDASFSLVYQSTMLSSVLDRSRRARILREVRRVLAPGGLFVSYDTRYPNPWNGNTRPVSAAEFRAAFPGCRIRVRSTTPIPQLIRILRRLPRQAWRAIEWVPFFRSHLLMVVRMP
jgi:SAM-dependent methyltransferase